MAERGQMVLYRFSAYPNKSFSSLSSSLPVLLVAANIFTVIHIHTRATDMLNTISINCNIVLCLTVIRLRLIKTELVKSQRVCYESQFYE